MAFLPSPLGRSHRGRPAARRAAAGLVVLSVLAPGATDGRAATGRDWPASEPVFEQNRGQADRRARFVSRSGRHVAFLTPSEFVLALRPRSPGAPPEVVRLRPLGGRKAVEPVGEAPRPGRTHYYKGRDPRRWTLDVPRFGRVRYAGLWRGVDLVFQASRGSLEYDLIVAPGARLREARFRVEGARRLEIAPGGDLRVLLSSGSLVLHAPEAYQGEGRTRTAVAARFRTNGRDVFGFALGPHDRGRPVVIDPVIGYSTYLGGTNEDQALRVAVDPAGYVYVAGLTYSADFPATAGAGATCRPPGSCTDAFVAKLDPRLGGAASLVYAAFLGGSDVEWALGVAADSAGAAYVVGKTSSNDFPTTPGSWQPSCFGGPSGNCHCGFAAKIAVDGSSLLYATHVSGDFNEGSGTAAFDEATGVAVDAAGNAYVTGSTASGRFPVTPGAFQETFGGARDAFVLKLDPAGANAVYSTYVGGRGTDEATDIALDGSGSAAVAGRTDSDDLPTVSPLQASRKGLNEGFVTRLDPSGGSAVYSTYLGGSDTDQVLGLAASPSGDVWVTGQTKSVDFPTSRPLYGPNPGTSTFGDAFAARIGPDGSALAFSTYLGGSYYDYGTDVAVDAAGNASVVGETNSPDFPAGPSVQPLRGADAFLATLDPAGASLLVSTPLGGSGGDAAWGVAVDGRGSAYVGGRTFSSDFPVVRGLQEAQGWVDGFLARVDPGDRPHGVLVRAEKTASGVFAAGGSVTYAVRLVNHGADPQPDAPGDEFVDVLPAPLVLESASAGTVTADLPANTVRWNGTLAAGASVTVTMAASIPASVVPGTVVSNQGTAHFDADLDGVNETSTPTTDPARPGEDVPTVFTVGQAFHTLAPCRVLDTRSGPPLSGQADRPVDVAGLCGVPATARAVVLNLTATGSTSAGNLRLHPAGTAVPSSSSLNYAAGQTRGNNAIAGLGPGGRLALFCGQPAGTTTHAVIDVSGFFE